MSPGRTSANVPATVAKYDSKPTSSSTRVPSAAGMAEGTRVELDVGFESYFATVAGTFADVRPGDILLYEDSYRNVALAINGGNAAETLAVRQIGRASRR